LHAYLKGSVVNSSYYNSNTNYCLQTRSPFLFGSQNDNVVDKDESSDDEDEDKEGEKDMKGFIRFYPIL
jgi:hypothetical protein